MTNFKTNIKLRKTTLPQSILSILSHFIGFKGTKIKIIENKQSIKLLFTFKV